MMGKGYFEIELQNAGTPGSGECSTVFETWLATCGKDQEGFSFCCRRRRSMNSDSPNNRVRRYLFVIPQNGFDLSHDLIDCFSRPAGQPLVIYDAKKFECAHQVVPGLENSTIPVLDG
jgi:hypothetical protein